MTQTSPERNQSNTEEDNPDGPPTTDVAERKEKLDADVDAILDEIDEVLETNAEKFVRDYVQKGGE